MTELEQFIAKLEELERTMTGGKWGYQGLHSNPPLLSWLKTNDGAGCAHLKNANPTVIAMLKAAMKELQGVVEYWNGAPESAVDAIETVADRAHNCLAHLDTLAASALGTKGARDEQ